MSIKILTVEDSKLIQTMINNTIKRMDGIELVGTAENGAIALEKIQELKPDIITLDMVMPVMNGLETLKRLREFSDIPVIVLSAQDDEETTIQALDLGAQDFLTKPESIAKHKVSFQNDLEMRIKALIHKNTEHAPISPDREPKKKPTSYVHTVKALAIGASTGGPKMITTLISQLPKTLSIPVFIVQHMPKGFTTSFAKRLDTISDIRVVEAEHGMRVLGGVAYIAPGGYHMIVQNNHIQLLDTEKVHSVKPAVDPLFDSIAQIYGKRTLGIILTGMGKDGAIGCQSIKNVGGYILAQDKETSVVYGMPRHAVELGAVDEILSINEISQKIKEMVNK